MNLTVLALHYILFFVLLHGQLKPTCKISHQKHAVLPVFPWQFLLGSFYIFTTVAVLRLELVLSMWYFIFWHLHLQVSFSVQSSQLFRYAPTVASSPQTGQNYFCSRCLSPRRRPCPSLRDWIHWVWRPHPTPSALSQVCFCLSLDPVLFHLAQFLENIASVCLQRKKRLWCGCRSLHSVC